MRLLLALIAIQVRRHPRMYALLGCLIWALTVLWIAEPLFSQYAINQLMLLREGKTVDLRVIFGGWLVLFILLSIFQTAEKYMTWKVGNTAELERSTDLYRHVLDLDISFHTQQKSGEVVKLIDEGSENLAELQRNVVIEIIPSA